MSYDLNYYEGFAHMRERDIRRSAAATEPVDDYVPVKSRFRTRVGAGLIGLGLYVLNESRSGLSEAA